MRKPYGHNKTAVLCVCLMAAAAVMTWNPVSLAADKGGPGTQLQETGERLITMAGSPGYLYEDGMAGKARFAGPMGLGVRDGMVMIADTGNNMIRCLYGRRVVTNAGKILPRDFYGLSLGGYYDNFCPLALFNKPADCVFDDRDRVIISDQKNHVLRMMFKGRIYTLAGDGTEGYQEGSKGGVQFASPSGLALGKDGSVYVADTGNHCIRKVDFLGRSTLVAGVPGQGGLKDGEAAESLFQEPMDVAVAADGTVYVADTGNQRIRMIRDGQVTTIAGSGEPGYQGMDYCTPGYRDGDGKQAEFRFPRGICAAGDQVIVADTGNHRIRSISPEGTVTTIAGSGEPGASDGEPLTATLLMPGDVEWEDGSLYIMDSGNSMVRKMKFEAEEEPLEENGMNDGA